ncbi:hypothetical protein AB4Y32_05565 [Paraburkholderia phymatum]|uniref:Uncharacterized protein n=1 Tax=Paraburkholderia phymatum TaxID=148447 RepID=A0ACC6TV03_9BURK
MLLQVLQSVTSRTLPFWRRETTIAGFNFNQIISAASEIISELSNSVRKHKDSHSRRAKIDNPGDDELTPGAISESYSRADEVMNDRLNRPG